MKKVLIEGMTENKGGKETFIINIYKKLIPTNQYEFYFIAYDKQIAYEDYLKQTGASVIHVPPRNKGLIKYMLVLDSLLRHEKYDVVWAHKTTLSACELLFLSKLRGVRKRIVHSHSSSNMGGRFTYLMHSINKVLLPLWVTDRLACSESAAQWFYRNDNYQIINNGIDVERFRFDPQIRESIRKDLGLEGSFVVGHVGRFGVEKNHTKLLNVFYEVKKLKPDAKLVLCGDGEERTQIETLIEELKLKDSVLLLGVINNVHQVLQAMDVLMMPSLFEGLPFALLEAQASGLRCVVSDTVSQESNITGQTVFLPLDLDNSKWAQELLRADSLINRFESASVISNNGYNINCSVKEIEQILLYH